MAAPKGYDRDEIYRLRQLRYEQTGEWRFASDYDLTNQVFVTDPFGNALYDENTGRKVRATGGLIYDPNSGRYVTGSPRTDYSPKKFKGDLVHDDSVWTGDTSGGMVLRDEEVDTLGINTRPTQLTQIPTSSTNAARPRTVAAGYRMEVGSRALPREQRRGKLTVMFRDGTLWNYYDVPYTEWLTFSNSLSKGPMLNRKSSKQASDGILLSHPHGPADVTDVPEEVQEQLWRVAREAQLRFKTTNRGRGGYIAPDRRISRKPGQLTEEQLLRRKARAREYVPKSAAKNAGYNPNANKGKAPKPRNSANRRTK